MTTSSEEPEEPATPYSSRYTPSYTPSATPVTPTTPTTGYTPVPPATPASYQPTPPVSSQPAVSGYVYTKPENFSLTEELSKAKALFDKGSINEQEYMQLKNQILNS